MGRRNGPSDHDMILEVWHDLRDDGGIRDQLRAQQTQISEIHCALVGTLNGKPGFVQQFTVHCQQHEAEQKVMAEAREEHERRLGAILTAVAGSVGAVVSWLVNWLLRR